MAKEKIELSLQDESGQECVAYPFVESTDVSLSNGMDIETMIAQDVSMPIVAHEETSFKVGVGDSDVSNSIVDSSVANMTIKGQTYQNILPEPSLRNAMTDGKTMQKINEGYENVEVVDGVSKSAILSGQTLVNMIPTINSVNWSCRYNGKIDGNTIIMSKVSGDTNSDVYVKQMNLKLEANKTYLLCYEVVNNVGEVTQIRVNNNSSDNTWILSANDLTVGKHALKITTSPSTTVAGFQFYNCTSFNSDASVTLKNVVLTEYQEGMENWDIPYFEGMTSCKMPVLKATGKNLFDGEFELDKYLKEDGTLGASTNWATTKNYISVRPNTTYTQNIRMHSYIAYVIFYDKNKNIVGAEVGFDVSSYNSASYTTPNNCYYIKTCYDYSSVGNHLFQVEEGSTATEYEPYKSNILSCELVPMNQSMFEQGSFSESTTPNTQPYEGIKLNSGNFYDTRIRTKGTYKVARGATYEVQLNDGYGIFVCFCKNGLYSVTINRWLDGTRITFTVPNDCDEMFFALRKTDNSAITPSDYSRIGLKIHQEVVLRSLPNGVCDTLNLQTGEYVQRIGEVVFDGSTDEGWYTDDASINGEKLRRFRINGTGGKTDGYCVCDKLTTRSGAYADYLNLDYVRSSINLIWVYSSNVDKTVAEFKQELQQNPLTVQYELATPVVKTVDLSSSGNWEKVVLDGSEDWVYQDAIYSCNGYLTLPKTVGSTYLVCDKLTAFSGGAITSTNHERFGVGIKPSKNELVVNLPKKLLTTLNNNGIKEYFAKNPATVWYHTNSTQSSSIKEVLSFSNGHIQLSSGVENSLIPSLSYEVPTTNSCYLDLAKPNTKYTMKNMSGTFTIDGTQYSASANGTFTTPSSMTDKLMVTSVANSEAMIIEGDVTSKDMSYFKGIKSAFEDEDKIEVLSTSQNILDTSKIVQGDLLTNGIIGATGGSADSYCYTEEFIPCPNIKHPLYVHRTIDGVYSQSLCYIFFFNEDKKLLQPRTVSNTFTIPDGAKYLRIMVHKGDIDVSRVGIMVTNSGTDRFNQSVGGLQNNTKIPLLSPLRSLPNRVKDEVILDRENHKAKIIQRVGETTLNGSENWVSYGDVEGYYAMQTRLTNCKGAWGTCYSLCDKLRYNEGLVYYKSGKAYTLGAENDVPNAIYVCLPKSELTSPDAKGFKQWMRDNTPVVTYRLATPIITEIDLEGFPYIYKDGHIFLDTDIAPTSEITYSINQQQQIEASNEDLMRHEKKITNLHKLIGTYVNVEYESTLLALNLELK